MDAKEAARHIRTAIEEVQKVAKDDPFQPWSTHLAEGWERLMLAHQDAQRAAEGHDNDR